MGIRKEDRYCDKERTLRGLIENLCVELGLLYDRINDYYGVPTWKIIFRGKFVTSGMSSEKALGFLKGYKSALEHGASGGPGGDYYGNS